MKMVFSRKFRWLVLTASMILLPMQQLLAANPQLGGRAGETAVAPSTEIRDVALQAGGTLRGQVVDAQGNPAAQVAVRVVRLHDRVPLTVVQTDAQGQFHVHGLTGGVYRIETPDGAGVYRLWAPNTAPPSATASALVVHGDSVVRGNLGSIGWFGWTLIGLGVAAAIAIPLALDRDSSS